MRALLLALVLAGCSTAGTETSHTFELGTGSWRFETIEDGEQLDMIRGVQGGWHVWLAFRTDGLGSTDRAMITTESQPADETRPPSITHTLVPFDPPDREGLRSHVAWTEIILDPSCLVGETMRVRATLEYPDGTTGSDEHYFTPMGGAYPPPACGVSTE